MIEEKKVAIHSMGVWGSILTLLPVLDVAYSYLVAAQETLPESVQFVVVALGGVMSLLGRLRAKSEIEGVL